MLAIKLKTTEEVVSRFAKLSKEADELVKAWQQKFNFKGEFAYRGKIPEKFCKEL